ncbi:hypothetical protein KR038_007106 [Drosophila bunnanda]|nr:hypothetical protein KR038_007106 [Drosophila bunnanda]
MGVIYKILKQQRQQHHRGHHLTMDLSLSSATRCKVQAAIKQRQQHRQEQHQELEKGHKQEQERQQEQERRQESEAGREDRMEIDHKEDLAEQQLQQLCRFLADNAARKKRQRFKLQYQDHDRDLDHQRQQDKQEQEQELEMELEPYSPPPHEMAMEFIEQLQQSSPAADATSMISSSSGPAAAPRDSILLKIRHQIFERKRQRQRQLAELVQQRLVVWRPW